MKEKMMALWARVVENKDLVIRVGGAAVGALVGVAIAAALSSNIQLTAEDLLSVDDDGNVSGFAEDE